MNRKQRLLNTLAGKPVDRPAVCFYELNGLDQDPDAPGDFNIFAHPTWRPAIELARQRTDRIVLRYLPLLTGKPDFDFYGERAEVEQWSEGSSQFQRTTLRAGGRRLTQLTRRDADVFIVWELEYFLKDLEDLKAWLMLPLTPYQGQVELSEFLDAEHKLGDSGIVAVDAIDPLCFAAQLFDMATFTTIATYEPALFQQALEKIAAWLMPQIEAVALALPGKLWRICGPEYATPPTLNPKWFDDYVVRYNIPIVAAIHAGGGLARLHCHGRIKRVLDRIAATGCDALDPIEPPPQGDVELSYVREHYGRQMVLFGNLEASDLENLPQEAFRVKIRQALEEGTRGDGRGFVLMPSAIPYGRILSTVALKNFEAMIEEVEEFG
jgi:uroporphyrinogen-III decarboxylase